MNNLIKYYDKSIGKLVVVDSKTGFSSYQDLNDNNSKQTIDRLILNSKNESIEKNKQKEQSFNGLNEEFLEFGSDYGSNNSYDNGFALSNHMRIESSIKLDKYFLLNANLRVIGQVDHKFIICLLVKQNLLLAFDQHAIHERIRFETILKNAFDDKTHKIKTNAILPPIEICLDLDSTQLNNCFNTYRNQIKSLVGFELKEGSKPNHYLVTQIPECLERSLDCDSMVDIIKEAVIILKESNGSDVRIGNRLTPKLLDRIQSKSCHGAIRFGDALKLHDCRKLINSLSKCTSCFRCAHGRTSVAPLLYLPQKFN
jgi:DNA mismatch repair protein MLH3